MKAQAKHRADDVRDRATTASGKPRPELVAAGVALAAVVVGLIVPPSATLTPEGDPPMMKKTPCCSPPVSATCSGARAGRGRYEQIKSGAQKFAGDPRVQAAKDKATDAAKEKAGDVAHAAADKVRREASIQPAP